MSQPIILVSLFQCLSTKFPAFKCSVISDQCLKESRQDSIIYCSGIFGHLTVRTWVFDHLMVIIIPSMKLSKIPILSALVARGLPGPYRSGQQVEKNSIYFLPVIKSSLMLSSFHPKSVILPNSPTSITVAGIFSLLFSEGGCEAVEAMVTG